MNEKLLKVICVEEYNIPNSGLTSSLNSEWCVFEDDWNDSSDLIHAFVFSYKKYVNFQKHKSIKKHVYTYKKHFKTIEEVRILKLNEIFDE